MKIFKIVILTIIGTLLAEALIAYGYYEYIIKPTQDKHLARMHSSMGNLSCFPNQRKGLMSSKENKLFSKIKKACVEQDIKSLNSHLYIEENELSISCLNNESTFIEPNAPVAKYSIKNISKRALPPN